MAQPSWEEYVSIIWILTGLAILLSLGRFMIRKRVLEGLRLDDATHALAMMVLIPFSTVCTMIYPLTVTLEIQDATASAPSSALQIYGAATTSTTSSERLQQLFRLEFAGQFLSWTVLYAVKFTFLIFFQQIFGINRVFMKWWWALFIYTWLAFGASFLTPLWLCGSPSDLFVLEKCTSPHASQVINNLAETAFALNVSTDLAIMILPICFLRDLQMPPSKKIAIACLFSVGLLVVVVEAMRLGTNDPGGVQKLDSLFNVVEPAIAVIVACLPTYKSVIPFHGDFGKKRIYQYPSRKSLVFLSSTKGGRLTAGYQINHDDERCELSSDKTTPPTPISAMTWQGNNV